MDLLVRDINPSIVKELDEKAKRSGVSRQLFLKNLLESYSMLNDINDREMEYRKRLERNNEILLYVGEQLEKNNAIMKELLGED